MNDITAIGWFLACLIATYGLLHACEWLRPASQAQGGSAAGTVKKETRQ